MAVYNSMTGLTNSVKLMRKGIPVLHLFVKNGSPITTIIARLRDKGIISNNEVILLRDLQRMRNKVVHEADLDLTQDDVTKFLLLANFVEDRFMEKENQVL